MNSVITTLPKSTPGINTIKSDIANFLFQKDLIQLILAVYLGTVLQSFFTSVVQGFILPIILIFVPNAKVNHFENIEITFMGATIRIGEIIFSLINLCLGFFIAYFFVEHILVAYLKQ